MDGSRLVWAYPGGRIENDETPKEAAVRETRAETGYDVSIVRKIDERDHPQIENVHIHYFAAEPADMKVKPIQDVYEIEQTRWIDPKEIYNYITMNIAPGVKRHLGIQDLPGPK